MVWSVCYNTTYCCVEKDIFSSFHVSIVGKDLKRVVKWFRELFKVNWNFFELYKSSLLKYVKFN